MDQQSNDANKKGVKQQNIGQHEIPQNILLHVRHPSSIKKANRGWCYTILNHL